MANLLAASGFGGIVLAIVILLAMVTIHEFGHYVAGKILGFKINEFSVGFGPALFKRRSKKTGETFALRLIPLGGYCAFDGEDYDEEDEKNTPEQKEETEEPFTEMQENDGGRYELNPSEEQKKEKDEDEYPEPKGERFNDQAPWKRIIVLLAGAFMNYILALFIIITMFAGSGRPVYSVVKGEIPEGSTSQIAQETYDTGLKTGDILLEINGKDLYLITDYTDILDGKKQGDVVKVRVIRDGKKQTLSIPLWEDANPKSMNDTNPIFFCLGIAAREKTVNEQGEETWELVRGGALAPTSVKEGFFETIGHSFGYSFKIGGTILRSLGELLTGKLGIKTMGGPVTTIKVTSEVAASGWVNFLNIAAFIGVNLAVFNLLPIPALDGCKVIFCLIEWIRKKPVNRKVESIIHLVGILFLFGFAILVDFLQFF